MIFPKSSPKELQPHINTFVGTGNAGRRFELLCKYCRDKGTVSANSNTIANTKYLQRAAEKFSKQGWALDGTTPVCPPCNKDTSRLGKRVASQRLVDFV